MLLLALTTLAAEQPQCTVGGMFSECFATGCCADPTLACYKRPSRNHAECRLRQTSCVDSEEWLCPGWELCSERGEACMSSRCCKDSSNQCYQKNEHFAQCLPNGECLGLKDADTNVPWLCSVLREPAFCSDNWAECTSSKCCNDPLYTCYEKSAGFSKCMRKCPDPASSEPFTCELHDREQRDKAAFVATLPKSTTCSDKHKECTTGGCCADEGFHCYEKGPHFAMCLREIECATFWSDHPDCKIREIPRECSAAGHDCSKNHCCADLSHTCFQKDTVSHVAKCMRGCSNTGPGLEGWECNRLTASPPAAEVRPPPPAPTYRASRRQTCNSFADKNSLGDGMCSDLSDMFVCESSYRVSTELSATVAGATVMEPCVWVAARSGCFNGEPIECTPLQVAYVPEALPRNPNVPGGREVAVKAARAQGAEQGQAGKVLFVKQSTPYMHKLEGWTASSEGGSSTVLLLLSLGGLLCAAYYMWKKRQAAESAAEDHAIPSAMEFQNDEMEVRRTTRKPSNKIKQTEEEEDLTEL